MIIKNTHSTLTLALILSALMLSVLSAQTVHTANIEVTSNADDTLANLSGNSTCDLREAITAANTDTTVDACTHTGTDTITFAGDYTVTLDLALPQISTTMTIDGTGQTITISGASTYRIFYITAAGDLTINNLTITDGLTTGSSPNDFLGGVFSALAHWSSVTAPYPAIRRTMPAVA